MSFVKMARDDVVKTMDAWHALKERHRIPVTVMSTEPVTGERAADLMAAWRARQALPTTDLDEAFVEMIDALVNSQIMLLRAIEEVEARPWWKLSRRRNPYAH